MIVQGASITKAKAVSKARKRVIRKRSKAVVAQGGVLKRLVRSIRRTAKQGLIIRKIGRAHV